VVRARHDDTPHALLEGHTIDVVGQGDVLVLGPELGVVVLLPGRRIHPLRAHVPEMDHRVGATEVLAVLVAVGTRQVGDDQAWDLLTAAGRADDVDGHQIPALGELLEHPLADVAGRPRDHHASLGHARPSLRSAAAVPPGSRDRARVEL